MIDIHVGDKVRIVPEEIRDWDGPPLNRIVGDDNTGYYTVIEVTERRFRTEELRGSGEYHWGINKNDPAVKEVLSHEEWERKMHLPDVDNTNGFILGF